MQDVLRWGLIPAIVDNDLPAVQKDIARAVSNCCAHGTGEQVGLLMGFGCIEPLASLLDSETKEMYKASVKAMFDVLKARFSVRKFSQLIQLAIMQWLPGHVAGNNQHVSCQQNTVEIYLLGLFAEIPKNYAIFNGGSEMFWWRKAWFWSNSLIYVCIPGPDEIVIFQSGFQSRISHPNRSAKLSRDRLIVTPLQLSCKRQMCYLSSKSFRWQSLYSERGNHQKDINMGPKAAKKLHSTMILTVNLRYPKYDLQDAV